MSWIEVTTVADVLGRAAEEHAGQELVFPGERATFAELEATADRFARGLLGLGVVRGEHVGILAAPGIDYVAAFFAAAKLGAVPVPINARFKGRELGHVIPHADLRALFVSGGPDDAVDYAALVARLMPEAPLLRQVIHLGPGTEPGFLSRDELLSVATGVPAAAVRREQALALVRDLAMIMYTSGTTAQPKGCMLSHEAMVRQGQNYASRYGFGPGERFWDALPLFHIGGIVPLLGCLSAGARYVHPAFFDAGTALDQLAVERCTVAMPVFDTIWLAVLDHPRFPETDLGALRTLLFLGGPEALASAQARVPQVAQVSGTGSTESCGNLALGSADDPPEKRTTTCGRLMPGMELKIIDPETGVERPRGAVGELLLRGCGRFEGYYKEPDITAAVIDSDGWFHSGDLSSIDAEGYVTYVGREKDALKVGGENVAPLEVEDFLRRHPAVSIAAVVGVPDARYTEVPAAFVELAPGAEASEEELIAFCLDEIATFKVPRYVRFVAEWPMSGTKIEKRTLRARLTEELRAAGAVQAPRVR
ncbi:MAG: hypothetical protein JWN32_398 [Solirubrobacterales bacterium]|nr:hypothetical protein [Solirubrobacterales bacterium]